MKFIERVFSFISFSKTQLRCVFENETKLPSWEEALMSITEPPKAEARSVRVTTTRLKAMKERGEKIVMLTAYDYSTARIADAAGIHALLVGDSLGQVMLGYDSTVPVTMDDMV